jgi:hypothetical protein
MKARHLISLILCGSKGPVPSLDTLTAREADAARTIRLRAACVPRLTVASQQNGALLRAVIVHAPAQIAGNARQRLAIVVVDAAHDAGRGAGQALGAIVVRGPAGALPPQIAKAREGPAATVKERPRLLSSCSRRPGRQGQTCEDRINDRLHDSAAPWGLACCARAEPCLRDDRLGKGGASFDQRNRRQEHCS